MFPFEYACLFSKWALALLVAVPVRTAAQLPGASPTRSGIDLDAPTRLFVVDDTPSRCSFSTSIQAAVLAASEGDVILVKSGVYASFTIDGKSLCVIGRDRPEASFEIRNLQADQRVIVRGFQGRLPPPRFTNNAGPIWIEDCSWESDDPRVSSLDSTVGLIRCQVVGAPGYHASRSTTFAYHSRFVGRRGNNAYFDEQFCAHSGGLECNWNYGEDGGFGLTIAEGSAYLFGCTLRGGRGGSGASPDCRGFQITCGAPDYIPGGCGGNALSLGAGTEAIELESRFVGGVPDCDHTPVSGSGSLTSLAGMAGRFSVDSPVRAGEPVHYQVKGPPGRKAFVSYSSDFAPLFEPDKAGMDVIPIGTKDHFIGRVPGSGVLEVTRSFGNLLKPGSQARVIFVQAKFHDENTCSTVLGAPTAVVVIGDPCL